MLGRAEPGPDLVGLTDPQPRAFDLARLVLGELQPPDELARVEGQLAQGGLIRPPGFDRSSNGHSPRLEVAERVEQVALAALVEELLLVVLAMDLDERPGDLGQPRRGHRLIAQAGRGPAAGGHVAGADQVLIRALHPGRDSGHLGPVPDEAAVGPRTEGQAEGIDQEALAGPRLAGDHVEARTEGQVQPVDQGQVGDRELEQAARTCWAGCPVGCPRGFDVHQLGRSSTLCRRRSQNGIALFGSTKRIGASRADTSTTSPTFSRMSS